jgi:hypothetical protein
MEEIQKARSISIWIFVIPFVGINTCLILITQFHNLYPNHEDIINSTLPYLDGSASISRTARPFPNWIIFKLSMFLTSFFLIKYWLLNKEIINFFYKNHKHLKKIIFFGVASAVALALHATFLGIKFDNDLYKLFRRVVLLSFVFFEIIAQTYLVITYYSFRDKLKKYINGFYLKAKICLVSTLVLVTIISLPLISLPGNKFLKHALEWNYFLGVIFFYMLTFFMWKKKVN